MGEKKDSGGPEEREKEMGKSGEKKENFIFVDPILELLHCESCDYHSSLAHVASEIRYIHGTHCYCPDSRHLMVMCKVDKAPSLRLLLEGSMGCGDMLVGRAD